MAKPAHFVNWMTTSQDEVSVSLRLSAASAGRVQDEVKWTRHPTCERLERVNEGRAESVTASSSS